MKRNARSAQRNKARARLKGCALLRALPWAARFYSNRLFLSDEYADIEARLFASLATGALSRTTLGAWMGPLLGAPAPWLPARYDKERQLAKAEPRRIMGIFGGTLTEQFAQLMAREPQ